MNRQESQVDRQITEILESTGFDKPNLVTSFYDKLWEKCLVGSVLAGGTLLGVHVYRLIAETSSRFGNPWIDMAVNGVVISAASVGGAVIGGTLFVASTFGVIILSDKKESLAKSFNKYIL